MGRRTKAEIEKERLPILINDMIQYIFKFGNKVTKNFAYWNTYPVCIREYCVTTVAYIDDKIVFGDFDEEKKEFTKISHTNNDVEYSYILAAFEDMKSYDKKYSKKVS